MLLDPEETGSGKGRNVTSARWQVTLRHRSHIHEYKSECMSTRKHDIQGIHRDEFGTSPSCVRCLLVRVQFAQVVFLGSSYKFCFFTLRRLIRHK